jgi:hypothetical protein
MRMNGRKEWKKRQVIGGKEANESGEKVLFPTTSGQRHVVWRSGVVA